MILKCSYLPQKIKWERALGKPTASIVKPILILVHHQPHGGLAPKNKEIWTLHMDKTRYVYSRSDHPQCGALYLVTLIVKGQ